MEKSCKNCNKKMFCESLKNQYLPDDLGCWQPDYPALKRELEVYKRAVKNASILTNCVLCEETKCIHLSSECEKRLLLNARKELQNEKL